MPLLREKVTVEPVSNLAELKAIATTDTSNGTIVNVADLGVYGLDTSSSFTPDDDSVVAPTVGPGQWLKKASYLFKNPYVIVNGTDPVGRDYATVKEAVDAGHKFIFVTGNTTDNSNITISTATLIKLSTAVSWIVSDSTITCNAATDIMSDSYASITFFAATSSKTMFAGSQYVVLRNVSITNLSAQSNSGLAASGLSVYAYFMDYSAPNLPNCGVVTDVFSVFEDCYISGSGSMCSRLFECTNEGHVARCWVYGANDVSSGYICTMENSEITGLTFSGLSSSSSVLISKCKAFGIAQKGADVVNLYIDNGGDTTKLSSIKGITGQSLNIYMKEGGAYTNIALNAGSINVQYPCSIESFAIISGSLSVSSAGDNCQISSGVIESGNLLVGTADRVTLSGLTVYGSLDNTVEGAYCKVMGCFFEKKLQVQGDSGQIVNNTIGIGSTSSTIEIASGADNNIVTGNQVDASIVDSGTGTIGNGSPSQLNVVF